MVQGVEARSWRERRPHRSRQQRRREIGYTWDYTRDKGNRGSRCWKREFLIQKGEKLEQALWCWTGTGDFGVRSELCALKEPGSRDAQSQRTRFAARPWIPNSTLC